MTSNTIITELCVVLFSYMFRYSFVYTNRGGFWKETFRLRVCRRPNEELLEELSFTCWNIAEIFEARATYGAASAPLSGTARSMMNCPDGCATHRSRVGRKKLTVAPAVIA